MPINSKNSIFELLSSNADRVRRFGVTRIGLFGSFVRGEAGEESDVDVLVEFQPERKTFDNFIGLATFLEGLFHRRVELVTPQSLSPYLGPRILEQVEYAALDT
ncbi:MAG: nucleotidyltransferase family protein [Verrucomicrobia bacterium]|nr:nucleotidyltransferase family protein [Verrucomicrobiota bacterium]